MLFTPAIDLWSGCFPHDIIKQHVSRIIEARTHFKCWNQKCLRICRGPGPRHGESSEIWYFQGLGDMYPCHGGWAFNEDIGILARLP